MYTIALFALFSWTQLAKAFTWDQITLNTTPTCKEACEDLANAFPDSTFNGAESTLHTWSLFQSQVTPRCIVQPLTSMEVATILRIVQARSCHFSIFGGGTSPFRGAAIAENGATIDLRRMDWVKFVNDDRQITALEVGGGATWNDVYAVLDPLDLYAVGTRNSLTGVVGSILGGGISFFSLHHGWSCDNVQLFEVVLANGSIVHATEDTNKDLFWALRGGGSNFGVVTKVVIDVYRYRPSVYTLQRWDMRTTRSVFERLDSLTLRPPSELVMASTLLEWSVRMQEFIIHERILWSEIPNLPKGLPLCEGGDEIPVLEQYIYNRTILETSEVMDYVNPEGYFNMFGSMTVKSDVETHMLIADMYLEEATTVLDIPDIAAFIVYNPVTTQTMQQMRKRGGNALGMETADGPLSIVNFNLRWSNDADTPRMREFLERMLSRTESIASKRNTAYPYIFLNHCYESQKPLPSYGEANYRRLHKVRESVDAGGVFQILQRGIYRLGIEAEMNHMGKTEL